MYNKRYFISDARNRILDEESVDLVITDPPFNIKFTGKQNNYNRKKTVANYTELDDPITSIPKIIKNIHDVLKPFGSFWLAMGWNNLSLWETECKKYFNQIGHVIWKYQFGVYAKKKPVASHYHLLIYTKNNKKWIWNQQGYDEDVWIINRDYKKNQIKYPNRLPEKLVEQIILRSSNIGDIIYDPFCGSGTIIKVSQKMERIGIGSDIQDNRMFWDII